MPNGVLLNVGGLADELLAPASFDDDDTASHTTLGIDPSSFAIAMTGADGIYVKIPYAYQSTTAIQYALANIRHPDEAGRQGHRHARCAPWTSRQGRGLHYGWQEGVCDRGEDSRG